MTQWERLLPLVDRVLRILWHNRSTNDERENVMGIPHPIPYQGSKRHLARAIIAYFPRDAERLVEPFAGSGAVSLAAAFYGRIREFHINDLNHALVALWNEIINNPGNISDGYAKLWKAQAGREREFYNLTRAQFNKTQCSDCFLYLLTRCVKASIRYNSNGEFNQSPDNRRKGARPDTMRTHVFGASKLLRGKTTLTSLDYREVVMQTSQADIVYMDPPYQGVCGSRDPRYVGGFSPESFTEVLQGLNSNAISYIVSYDGRTGTKTFGKPLPEVLNLTRIEIEAGRSSQATLLGRNDNTTESLYLSPALVARIGKVSSPPTKLHRNQRSMFEALA